MTEQESTIESLQRELKVYHQKIGYLEDILYDNDIKESHTVALLR